MDFPFDLNSLFPERISVLDHNLCAARKPHARPDAQNQTAAVIDELGKASAKAQKLPAPITSAAKLQANRHYLYLLKDGERNGSRGVAVGYLKVGYKKLFLLEQRGAHVETEPLCVLDFYVTESLQRHGYGLELFHFMLEHKKVEPEQMAYDRPSSKFLAFLEKHFELKHSVPQVNNFVVFDGFFRNRSGAPSSPVTDQGMYGFLKQHPHLCLCECSLSPPSRKHPQLIEQKPLELPKNSKPKEKEGKKAYPAQLRKPPPKKPEGEIKPYSLMEREAVREEQKALPWPFVRSTAVPQSPPPAASSPFSRSLSVGSSPSHTPRPQPHIPPHMAENFRTKRTSAQGLVARNNLLYSRHVNSRGLGLLMTEQLKLPGLKPVLSERVCDAGEKADALGHTNTPQSSTHLQGSSVFLPPLPAVIRQQASDQEARNEAIGAPDTRTAPNPRHGERAERDGWSWTVDERRCTAQWVRQKHEFRSTRPW